MPIKATCICNDILSVKRTISVWNNLFVCKNSRFCYRIERFRGKKSFGTGINIASPCRRGRIFELSSALFNVFRLENGIPTLFQQIFIRAYNPCPASFDSRLLPWKKILEKRISKIFPLSIRNHFRMPGCRTVIPCQRIKSCNTFQGIQLFIFRTCDSGIVNGGW